MTARAGGAVTNLPLPATFAKDAVQSSIAGEAELTRVNESTAQELSSPASAQHATVSPDIPSAPSFASPEAVAATELNDDESEDKLILF